MMFRSARWRSDKNKVKVEFKFQFHATQIPELNFESLIVSVSSGDAGKPSARTENAAVQDGSCYWNIPIHETVKFVRDSKTGKFGVKTFRFVVSTIGSLRNVGEVYIDLGYYAIATKASSVSLPMRNSKYKGFLNISIQRLQNEEELRWSAETEDASSQISGSPLSSYDYQDDIKGLTMKEVLTNESRNCKKDINLKTLSSNNSSGYNTPNHDHGRDPENPSRGFVSKSPQNPENGNNKWGWTGDSDHGTTTDDSTQSTLTTERAEEASDTDIGKLKSTIMVLLRQVDMSELELQTLRKQIVKENKKFQEVSKELSDVKGDRNALLETMSNGSFDSNALFMELKIENASLSQQLQKSQESNAELLITVKNLESMAEGAKHGNPTVDDVATKRKGDREAFLEQKVTDLCSEIEIYKRDKEEIEIQLEQIALDYEILKQENHNLLQRVEQSQLEDQLKAQYECCSSSAEVNALGTKLNVLEKVMEEKSEQYSQLLLTVNDLRNQVSYLEDELDERGKEFEANLGALTAVKIEQEKRAIRAEEALRSHKSVNGGVAEKLQTDLKRLSVETKTFLDKNEETLAEVNEMRNERVRLVQMLENFETSFGPIMGQYEALLNQLHRKENEFSMMVAEACGLSRQLENQKVLAARTVEELSDQIHVLKSEIDKLTTNRAEVMKGKPESYRVGEERESGGTRKSEVEALRERSNAMESELKEMQERYLEISVKFAEVEGERQQLVMALRGTKTRR